MNLLIDTHIWIWSKLEPKRIGKRAAEELSKTGNELWLSPVSVWEARAHAEGPHSRGESFGVGRDERPINCAKLR